MGDMGANMQNKKRGEGHLGASLCPVVRGRCHWSLSNFVSKAP